MEEKNLQLERLVFFSDAVIAIAITLLALDLKIEPTADGHLYFADIGKLWRTFGAFFLSFFNIANFWKSHHIYFSYIKKIDERLLWYNILWLLFIVLLPFTTSLVSNYFTDVAAIFSYSLNILLIAIFQNGMWDYASDRKFLNEAINPALDGRIRAICNLDMLNSAIGVIVSFISPVIAFLLLYTKLPIAIIAGIYYRRKKRAGNKGRGSKP